MKLRRTLILMMYVMVGALFLDLVLTGRALLSVHTVEDALGLLKLDYLILVRIFKVILDNQHNFVKLVFEMLRLVSLSFVLLWILILRYAYPYIKPKYRWYFVLIPLFMFVLSVGILSSLQSIDIKSAMLAVNILGYITFIGSSMGLLASIILFLCFGCHLIDVERVIDYNEHKGVSV